MDNPTQPGADRPDVAHIDTALQAHGQMIGAIQDALAQPVDAALAAQAKAIKRARASVRGTAQAMVNNSQQLTGNIASGIGENLAAALARGEITVQALGRAAATGGLAVAMGTTPQFFPPTLPPPQAGLPGLLPNQPTPALIWAPEYYELWYDCTTHTVTWITIYQAGAPQQLMNPVPPPGSVNTGLVYPWTIFSPGDLGSRSAAQLAAWIAANCPGGAPGPQPAPPQIPPQAPPPPIPLPAPAPTGSPPVPICPPVPTCPPVPVPIKPAVIVAPFPALTGCTQLVNGQLPPVGSVEWCQCISSLEAWLGSIGDWVAEQLFGDNGVLSPYKFRDAICHAADNLGAIPGVGRLLEGACDYANEALASSYGSFLQALSAWQTVTGGKLIGLALCRTLLNLLEKFRLGADPGLWATIDVAVNVRPFEKLLDYVENYAFQYEIPGVGEAIDCLLQHTAPLPQIYCWMECHGANPDIWHPVIEARRERLHDDELIQWMRRHKKDEVEQAHGLSKQGWIRHHEAEARIELYNELPTIQDHLHFLQRNVFDSSYVQDFHLLDGFAADLTIQQVMGYNYVSFPQPPAKPYFLDVFGDDLYSLGMLPKYAALHYAAHWINPSTGQLAEMMQRLRPGRVDPAIVFTPQDFERTLVEQDVAPYFRERIAYTSYRTLPLRQLNTATQQGRFDEAELSERWQDIGFRKSDADTMAKTSLVAAAKAIESAVKGYTPSFISDLAEYGMIDKAHANYRLAPQGFTPDQVDTLFTAAADRKILNERKKHDEGTLNQYATFALKAFHEGAISQDDVLVTLQQAGYSPDAANLALQTVILQLRMENIQTVIKLVRRSFLLGGLSYQEVLDSLSIAGVDSLMVPTLAQRWALEKTVPRIAASTAVILKWAKASIISVANAAIRLQNLGWNQTDIDLQLLELEQEIAQAAAKAKATKAAALAKAQKAAQAALAATQKQFCKLYTPGRMKKWYAMRIIDDGEFLRRLEQCGTSAADAQQLLEEAGVARQAADAKAAKHGPSGIQYTGPGAVPS